MGDSTRHHAGYRATLERGGDSRGAVTRIAVALSDEAVVVDHRGARRPSHQGSLETSAGTLGQTTMRG